MRQHQEQQAQTKQIQRLILSPQMQQALQLLQMPIQELSTLVQEEIALNPLLEIPDHDERELDIMPDLDKEWRTPSTNREEEDLKAFIENTLEYETSLYDLLEKQAADTFEDGERRNAASLIIGHLDHNGILSTPLQEIALLEEVELSLLEEVLLVIQTFDPKGVGARSMQEALLIQLKEKGKEESLAYRIIATTYDDMIHNRIPKIAKALRASTTAIQNTILDEIATLDLRPGTSEPEGHYKNPSIYITPDVVIRELEGQFIIEINEGKVPKIRFNNLYINMLQNESVGKEAKNYLSEKLSSGKWLMRNLSERHQTLYRIVEQITVKQASYLRDPSGKLNPLTMKEIAEILELHESTIARAVAGKYLAAPRGILPLRSFFTNAYTTETGDNISSKTVKECLREMIANEDKRHPLSDETLSKLISAKGITCARRTVAKYRVELGVGNTSQRKRHS